MDNRFQLTRSGINETAMWFVLGVVFLVPFALGGNRPLVWTIVCVVLSVLAIAYFLLMFIINAPLAFPLGKFGGIAAIIAIFITYILAQISPIAGLIPSSALYLPNGLAPTNTISVSKGDTTLALIRWYDMALVFFFVLQSTANRKRTSAFMTALFWIVFIHAVYGFFMFFEMGDTILFVEKWSYKGSMTGAFVNRNSFATFLASGSVIGLASIGSSVLNAKVKSRWQFLSIKHGVLPKTLAWLVVFSALASTNSRMGLFVGLLGSALVLLFYLRNRGETTLVRSAKDIVLVILLALLPIALIGTYGLSTLERLGSAEVSYDVRAQLYSQVWQMITLRPWTGYGGGTFETSYPMFHQLPVNVDQIWDKAHNTYLAVMVDYGLFFGLLPILAVMLIGLKLGVKTWRAPKPDFVLVSAFTVIIVAAAHALFDFSLEIQGYALFFTSIVAAGFVRSADNATEVSRHSK